MKKIVNFFLVICLFIAAVFLIYYGIFPLAYWIKEPRFKMPVETERQIIVIEDLLIRSDGYGDGKYGTKRGNGRRHQGVDLKAKVGRPVYASKSGWASASFFPTGYGHLVIINHPGTYETRYGHLRESVVGRFKWVRQGELIGYVGKTGNARFRGIEPHLHFEIRRKGQAIDPADALVINKKRKSKANGNT